MRILMDTGDYRCRNLGDVAMLQVSVGRFRALVPGVSIEVLTEDEEALAVHCPGTVPVPCRGRTLWFSERTLLGRFHGLLPRGVSRSVVRLQANLQRRAPPLFRMTLRWRLRRNQAESSALDAFADAATGADAVALSGAGGITDHARSWVIPVLQLLEMAEYRDVPTAIFGHGLGPLTDPDLLARAREVLPRAGLVALREGRTGPALARALGVVPERVVVTGDDAVELAYESRPARLGTGVGVNVRVSRSAGVEPATLELVRPALQAFARSRGTSLVPLPISFNERPPTSSRDVGDDPGSGPDFTDSRSIRELLSGGDETSDGGESVRTVGAAIEQAGRCRIVVTGAYHAAVFALAQGIPTVGLARSDYFAEKLLGLANQFGRGCEVLRLGDRDFAAGLSDAMRRAWDGADELRPELLEAARRQIEAGRGAYRRFAEDLLGARPLPASAGVRGA